MKARTCVVCGVALALCVGLSAPACAQTGISSLSSDLPSQRLGSGFYGGVSRGSDFTRGGHALPTGPLAVRFNFNPSRIGGGYRPSQFDFSDIRANLAGLRIRTLESFALAKRARFAGLQKLSLELATKVGGGKLTRAVNVRESFFQFVFPFGLRDKTDEFCYGYFCLGCLSRGLIKDPDSFLSEFSLEAQETIADESFMNAVASMFSTGKLPEGQKLDDLYDSKLAAMGNYLFSNRRYAAAAEVWQVLARRDASSSLYAQAAGQSLMAVHKLEAASDLLRASLQKACRWGTPEFRIAGANLQNIYADAGDLAEARMNLEAQVEKNPDDGRLQFLLAYTDVFHGLWDRAAARLGDLAGKGDAEAKLLLEALTSGRIAEEVRRPFAGDDVLKARDVAAMRTDVLLDAEARKDLVRAVFEPASYEDYMSRGDFYFFMGNYSKAAQSFKTAADMKADEPIAKFAQVHAAFANGEFGYAARRLREALDAEPDWGLYNFRIEEFFGDRHDMDKRIVDLEHVARIQPDDFAVKLLLGYVYYFDGRFDKSSELLAEVLADKDRSEKYKSAEALLTYSRLQS